MTEVFYQGFMDKLAEIKSPEDLDAFYKKLKYRVLNKDTNRPYFNTNFETFENWHLLSPEQIKKHKIGICYDRQGAEGSRRRAQQLFRTF